MTVSVCKRGGVKSARQAWRARNMEPDLAGKAGVPWGIRTRCPDTPLWRADTDAFGLSADMTRYATVLTVGI